MNEMFSQGGRGSTGILTNKQAIARKFGVKQSEVVYFSEGVDLGGYKVIYDKTTQRAYSLPTDISSGTTAISLGTDAVLVHSQGSVDLGELGVQREEFITVPGSFTTGATITTKNEVLTDISGLYRWGSDLPKIIPIDSSIDSTGGIADTAWISVGIASLRSQISDPEGATKYPELQMARWRDIGDVRGWGAKGDGITDDTSALILAAEYARESSRTLRAEGNFIITETLNLRNVSLEMTNAVFTISHSGIGVLLGGNASNPSNPRQNFGTIIRNSGISSETTPDIRIIGAKGQHINIERCDYLQLYANYNASVASTDYSIAYSTFNLKKVDTIHFLGVEKGWINENYFYLNRTNNIIFADNPYHHNHNKFYGGTMEGAGKIDIQRGDNNYFYGFRFERYPSSSTDQQLIINFGEYTWNNSIEATWLSSPAYTNEPYNPSPYTYVEVTDNGKGNAVFHIQENISDEVTLFSLDANTPFISSANNGKVGTLAYQTDVDGLYNIRHLVSSKFAFMRNFGLLWESGDIPVRNGDMFTFSADVASFRIYLYALDSDGNVLTSQTEAITSSMQWDSNNHRYTAAVNISSIKIRINNEGTPVSAIRLAIYSGSNVTNTTFSWLCLTGRYYKNSTSLPRKSKNTSTLKQGKAITYYSDTDINMGNIASGITCYKTDLSELKINLVRGRYVVKSISGNDINVYQGMITYYPPTSDIKLVYTDGVENKLADIQSISSGKITLADTVPSAISAGDFVDVIVTKTKTIT